MASAETAKNPLLSRIRIPGETFTLPSKGIFYTNGELDESVKNGELTITPMTALDEITIRSPDKLFSGAGITDVFNHCIPQVLKPLELYSKDIDFLLCCLRKVSYGEDLEISFKHDCENAKEHTYNISVTKLIKESKRLDPTIFKKQMELRLPNEQVIYLQPIRYQDIIELMQVTGFNPEEIPTTDDIGKQYFQILLSVISNVDEITDKTQIEEWVKSIPRLWAKQISERVDVLQNWGPNFNITIICKDCLEEVNVANQLNPISFFI